MQQPFRLNSQTSGNGPALVLIHGVAGSLRIWDNVVPLLEQDFRLVRLDLLGYGHSPKPKTTYDPQTHLEAVRNTLQQLKIKPPYNLVGLSMGVNIALEHALRYPAEVASLVAIGMPYYANEAAIRRGLHANFWTALTLEHPTVAAGLIPSVWWIGRRGLIPTRLISKIYTKPMARETLLNAYYAFKSSLLNCMVHNPLQPKLSASAGLRRLFIHGTEDTWASCQAVAAAVAPYTNSSFKTITDCGHNTAVIKPQQTAVLIKEFYSRTTIAS